MYVLISHFVSTPLWGDSAGPVQGAGQAQGAQQATAKEAESHWGRRLLMTAAGAGIGFLTGNVPGAIIGGIIGFGGGVVTDKAEHAINNIKKQQDENMKKALGE